GSSLNDIRELLKSIYKIDLSNQFLSELVDEISEDIIAWQTRKLKKLYTFMYVDCLYAPVKTDLASKKVAVYVIIGIDVKGKKEVVGIWIGDGAEAKSFWVNIFEELQRRGVEDIIHLSMDGLAGLKDGIETVFPRTITQRCIVHLVRNLYKITVKKESKEVIADYKKIYSAVTVEDADNELKKFVKKYETHKNIIKKVNENMQHIYPLFDVPLRIKKMIYTTNTIESVNSVLRKVTNGKGMFMNKNSLLKVLFLSVNKLEKKWDNGVVGWNEILNELIEIYGDRITKYIEI
ncbi:MAG: IS256 family transposase, partial [Bacilli bacterium]